MRIKPQKARPNDLITPTPHLVLRSRTKSTNLIRGSCRFFVIARSETTKQSRRLGAEIASPGFQGGRNDSISPHVSEGLPLHAQQP
jgi:hypothetical protein